MPYCTGCDGYNSPTEFDAYLICTLCKTCRLCDYIHADIKDCYCRCGVCGGEKDSTGHCAKYCEPIDVKTINQEE